MEESNTKKVYYLLLILLILTAAGVVIVMTTQYETGKDIVSSTEINVHEDIVDENDAGKNSVDENSADGNQVVSMFSWYFELTNQPMFYQLSEPLKELGVNRLYQIMPADYINEPEVKVMIQNLSQMGIETVILTGDKSWVEDGLAEYKQIVDSISLYNESANKGPRINAVALDVEVHTLPDWENNSLELFSQYVELMKQAKEYAAMHDLKIIQVIPTTYEEVDKELFNTFLKECCDELSIMNYNRKTAHKAMRYEVVKCKQYGIPVETIFETMPVSEEHRVTEEITYYYDGLDALTEDISRLKKTYGKELGIAYHHYSIMYEMCMGQSLGEVKCTGVDVLEEMSNPGNILLYDDEGSVLLGTPYWPKAKKSLKELSWLVLDAKENVTYSVEYYDLNQSRFLAEGVQFYAGNHMKLQAVIRADGKE